jgi:hypothetical protein
MKKSDPGCPAASKCGLRDCDEEMRRGEGSNLSLEVALQLGHRQRLLRDEVALSDVLVVFPYGSRQTHFRQSSLVCI